MTIRFLAVIAAGMLTSSAASAHILLEGKQAGVGADYKAVFVVPHGCSGSATVKLRVQIPEGVIVSQALPKAGWNLETTNGKYAGEYDYRGAKASEGIKEVAWSGGKVPDKTRPNLLHERPQARHDLVFSGRAGVRAGDQPLDRNPARWGHPFA
jgi:uncharacterized protein YcnI